VKKVKKAKKEKAGKRILKAEPLPTLKSSGIRDQGIEAFTRQALFEYGSYVVESRAVPDYRDGLKPVHRSLMWSLAGLGLRPNAAYKKAARTVGDTIGKYHPHGDQACYGAMVTIANTMPPVVDGQGNWGSPINNAAHMRYTEARMSKFAHLFMLDPQYLKVVPKIPNYSGDDTIPLYLPALLPFILFLGGPPVPAYGVAAGNPSFSLPSVAKVVATMLRGQEMDSKELAKIMRVEHAYGCQCISDKKTLREVLKTGRGSLQYQPEVVGLEKQKQINIRSFSPGKLSSKNSADNTLNKLALLDGVKRAYSKQGKKSKGSGPYGALYVVETKGLKGEAFEKLVEKVRKEVTSSVSVRLGVTIRKANDPNEFRYWNFVQFLKNWIKYRIALELRLIKSLIVEVERELHLNEVYLFAVQNMEKLLKALPKVLVADDPNEALAKILQIPVEDAILILDRKVRQLARLEEAGLIATIKKLKAELAGLKKDQKEPGERAARVNDERLATFLKNPDANRSGLRFTK
jgi:topoisomerase-4 subunit A